MHTFTHTNTFFTHTPLSLSLSDLNLSNSSYFWGLRHLVSLNYRLRANAIETKYSKDIACTVMQEKLSTNHILFNCHQLKHIFRNSNPPNSTINTFPTDVPGYVIHSVLFRWPMATAILYSPIGPLIWIVYECIFMLCMLVRMISVCTYIVTVVGLLTILSLSKMLNILRYAYSPKVCTCIH